MQAVIFIGIQGAGKTTFYRERFFATHIRLSLDMLRTRHRLDLLVRTCIEAKQPFVIDNTNTTVEQRARYIAPAKAAGFRIVGYYFASDLKASLRRNEQRDPQQRIPVKGVLATHHRLQLPTYDEGFDSLHYVAIESPGTFTVRPWADEVW
jgi:predicted kinase